MKIEQINDEDLKLYCNLCNCKVKQLCVEGEIYNDSENTLFFSGKLCICKNCINILNEVNISKFLKLVDIMIKKNLKVAEFMEDK